VPFGVLLALSTRLCLEPDRGVTLVLRKAETGDVKSSRSREAVPLALRVGSEGRGRRARGVARVGVWWWFAGVRAATLGVRGGLFTARAMVGCRGPWPAVDGRSYDGILGAVNGSAFGSGPNFTARDADVAFWSRNRSGWRGRCGVFAVVFAVEFAGQAVAVVVIRAVLLPVALVLVVKIPADGFLLSASGGGKLELSAAAADG